MKRKLLILLLIIICSGCGSKSYRCRSSEHELDTKTRKCSYIEEETVYADVEKKFYCPTDFVDFKLNKEDETCEFYASNISKEDFDERYIQPASRKYYYEECKYNEKQRADQSYADYLYEKNKNCTPTRISSVKYKWISENKHMLYIPAKYELICPDGYTPSESKCYKTTEKTITYDAKTKI